MAIKVLEKKGMSMGDLMYQMNETAILKALDSPYVASIIDVLEDIDHVYIVQELIIGVSLYKLTMSRNSPDEKVTQSIFKHLISGLNHL